MEAKQRRRQRVARPHRMQIRLSDGELAAVEIRAGRAGLAKAAFVMESALGTMPAQPDRSVLLAELMAIRRELAGLDPTVPAVSSVVTRVVGRLEAVLVEAGWSP